MSQNCMSMVGRYGCRLLGIMNSLCRYSTYHRVGTQFNSSRKTPMRKTQSRHLEQTLRFSTRWFTTQTTMSSRPQRIHRSGLFSNQRQVSPPLYRICLVVQVRPRQESLYRGMRPTALRVTRSQREYQLGLQLCLSKAGSIERIGPLVKAMGKRDGVNHPFHSHCRITEDRMNQA